MSILNLNLDFSPHSVVGYGDVDVCVCVCDGLMPINKDAIKTIKLNLLDYLLYRFILWSIQLHLK